MKYFVLPIYNEENNIFKLIVEIRSLMQGQPFKILAVNDGSSDSSAKILEELQGPDLQVVGSLLNMNIGAVFSLAIDAVLGDSSHPDDIMVILESDQTSSVSLVKDLMDGIEKKDLDLVVASRYRPNGGYRNFPFSRRIFSYSANLLLKKLFPLKAIADYTIFFRAYRVGVFKNLVACFGPSGVIQSKGFIANSELLIKYALFTDRLGEVPFVYDYGKKVGKSKMNIVRTINEYFVFTRYMKTLIKKMKVAQIVS